MTFSSGKSLADAKAEQEDKAIADESASILAELYALDRKSDRALRAYAIGKATDKDKAKLVQIETEAVALRDRLAELNG